MTNTPSTRLLQASELLDRCQQGTLSNRRLELAAHLGDPAARLAIQPAGRRFVPPARVPTSTDPRQARLDLIAWIEGLQPWGAEAWIRAAAAALTATHAPDRPPSRTASVCLGLTRRWLSCPCRQHARLAAAAAQACTAPQPDPFLTGPIQLALATATSADPARSLQHALAAILDATWSIPPQQLRIAIQRQLVPWALGYSDPGVRAA